MGAGVDPTGGASELLDLPRLSTTFDKLSTALESPCVEALLSFDNFSTAFASCSVGLLSLLFEPVAAVSISDSLARLSGPAPCAESCLPLALLRALTMLRGMFLATSLPALPNPDNTAAPPLLPRLGSRFRRSANCQHVPRAALLRAHRKLSSPLFIRA